ncbi:hypothetical protein L2E82_29611 [Cichorium intybus]|uniref:Uncharacterized protein n=1 Tax=Cichorium intybus TaxID=13427 RepID=A0ACB9CYQ6_CICIN|nr:hypothetical protein L2E82_29611 [Cichorium intybus]
MHEHLNFLICLSDQRPRYFLLLELVKCSLRVLIREADDGNEEDDDEGLITFGRRSVDRLVTSQMKKEIRWRRYPFTLLTEKRR